MKTVRTGSAKVGDLVGFSACSGLGVAVNLGTLGAPFWGLSHVGIVAGDPLHPAYRPLLYESTTLYGQPCCIRGMVTDGVQAHPLAPRVISYSGKVWLYPLSVPLADAEAATLMDYCIGELGTSYDALGAFRSRFMGLGWLARLLYRREDLTSLFCSELCASGLHNLGLLGNNASEWSPNALGRAVLRQRVCTKPERLK